MPPLHSETSGRKSRWEKPKRTKADRDFTQTSEAEFSRREVDDHICGSGESVSPKARASSGVRPFFSVRLTVKRRRGESPCSRVMFSCSPVLHYIQTECMLQDL